MSTNILQQKAYHLYFDKLGDIVRQFYNKHPENKTVQQMLKCTSEVGIFTNELMVERDSLRLRNSQLTQEKGDLYNKYLKLKEELKKYEI